jgi:methylated-DNA-[protein]-cysteine S-methyltransferase
MEKEISIEYFKTPFGELIIGSIDEKLCLCDWRYRKKREAIDKRLKTRLGAHFKLENSDIIEKTKIQLNEYFQGKREVFNIPILFIGSDFQKTVWAALVQIPFGKTTSYLELSRLLQNEKAIRAVAAANGANAISIIVPCHRVIGSDGKLVGYAGGLNAKMKLLNIEKALNLDQLSLF